MLGTFVFMVIPISLLKKKTKILSIKLTIYLQIIKLFTICSIEYFSTHSTNTFTTRPLTQRFLTSGPLSHFFSFKSIFN